MESTDKAGLELIEVARVASWLHASIDDTNVSEREARRGPKRIQRRMALNCLPACLQGQRKLSCGSVVILVNSCASPHRTRAA